MILVVDGVLLTTVSTALEPFQQVNTMLGEDRFHIQLVSRKSTNPMTSAGIPIHCHLTFTDVLAKLNLQNRPYLLIFYCGQVTSPTNQASAEGFTEELQGKMYRLLLWERPVSSLQKLDTLAIDSQLPFAA